MDDRYLQRLLLTARLYYEEGRTMHQVAEDLSTNRQMVSRYLQEAKDQGIVNVTIRDPLKEKNELEKGLENRFGLQGCKVIPADFSNQKLLRFSLARGAVDLLKKIVHTFPKEVNLGSSWGKTMEEFIHALSDVPIEGVKKVVPLIGAAYDNEPYFMLNEMVRKIGQGLNCEREYLHLPVHPDCPGDAELYFQTSAYRRIEKIWNNLDIAVTGIGRIQTTPYDDSLEYPRQEEVRQALYKKGAVGDLCTHYFDGKGTIIPLPEKFPLIRIPLKSLKKVPVMLAIAGGEEKTQALLGALVSGLVTHLVIDSFTAKRVVEL